MDKEESKKRRELIYVDASGKDNKEFKISLYDIERNATLNLFIGEVDNSTEAEKYAIYYAIYHIKKYDYKNGHILCDNLSATEDDLLVKLKNRYKIGLTWIPREANKIADKTSKAESTAKKEEANILKFIISLSKSSSFKEVVKSKDEISDNEEKEILSLKNKIVELQKSIETKNQKIKNQATQINNLKNKKK